MHFAQDFIFCYVRKEIIYKWVYTYQYLSYKNALFFTYENNIHFINNVPRLLTRKI